MIRYRISAMVSGLILVTAINGQYSGFNLSQYKLPDIKLNKLDFNFDLYHVKDNNITQQSLLDERKSIVNNFSGSLNLTYFHYRNSEKYQGDLTAGINSQPSINSNRLNGLESTDNSLSTGFSVYSTNRFFNLKQYFLEVDPLLSENIQILKTHDETSSTSTTDDRYHNYSTSISVPVSIGHGRIEPVEDARLAIYILEELNKAGRISTLPPDNVVIEMAKEISKIKNKRFFDSRLRKIEELQTIDSFLVANNIISTHDIRYFAVLNDQWDYASGPVRETGFAISVGFDNDIALSTTNTETTTTGNSTFKNKSVYNAYDLAGFLRIRYAKPVNLYWQTSLDVKSSLGRNFYRNPNDKSNPLQNFESNIFSTDLIYSWQFLPNSRTSVRLSLHGIYDHSFSDQNLGTSTEVYHSTNNHVSFLPAINIYYYISPQMRLQLASSFAISSSNNITKFDNGDPDIKTTLNNYHHSISLQFVYSFF